MILIVPLELHTHLASLDILLNMSLQSFLDVKLVNKLVDAEMSTMACYWGVMTGLDNVHMMF